MKGLTLAPSLKSKGHRRARMGENDHTVSAEWARRPDDQRFETLADLREAVERRKRDSFTVTSKVKDLRMTLEEAPDGLAVGVVDHTHGVNRNLTPTHWAFGQLASYAGAPGAYLRKLPDELAAINLQWGLEQGAVREDALLLGSSNGSERMRSLTSTSYGRIWDSEIVEAVERINEDGRWQIPAASYSDANPKRATTLYASDRDVFVFLVDPDHPIDVGGETLFRGFYTWNSEVGSAVWGLATFLYRTVCDNRIIWGVEDMRELRIRHTSGAPDKFAYEGREYLQKYSEGSADWAIQVIENAKNFELPEAEKEGKGWDAWLRDRGFTASQSKAAVARAQEEEGEARSLWDIVNGISAQARGIQHTDTRVKVEARAGKLLKYAA